MNHIEILTRHLDEISTITPTVISASIFPNHDYINEERNHISLIYKEGMKILSQKDNEAKIISGIDVDDDQYAIIVDRFRNDIELYITSINYLEITGKNSTQINPRWGQKVLTSKALFHIARSKELSQRYASIELFDLNNYEVFSIPFIIRLIIETKIKRMIGLDYSYKINKDNARKPFNFLTSKTLSALEDSKIIESPVKFTDIRNIYEWACNFTHTGEKDFSWLRLLAIECLDSLFKRPYKIHKIEPEHEVVSYIS